MQSVSGGKSDGGIVLGSGGGCNTKTQRGIQMSWWIVGLTILLLTGGLANNWGVVTDAVSGEATLQDTAVGLAAALATGMYGWDQVGTDAVLNYAGASELIIIAIVVLVYFFAFRLFKKVAKAIIDFVKPPKGWARESLIALILAFLLVVVFSGGLMFWRVLVGAVL